MHRNCSAALITTIHHPALGCGRLSRARKLRGGLWCQWGGSPQGGTEVSALAVPFLLCCLCKGNPCPGTRGSASFSVLAPCRRAWVCANTGFGGETGPAGSPVCARGAPCPRASCRSLSKGLDQSASELLSGVQESEPPLGSLQGSRYFAPRKWCHVFPAIDKVKPLI